MSLGARARLYLQEGYIYDWITCVILILFDLVILVEQIKPRERLYQSDDPSLSYPTTEGTVSGTALYTISFVLPFAVFGLFQFRRKCPIDWHHGALSLLEAYAMTLTFKRSLNLVGRLRPDWYSRLESGYKVENGRLSYPSGHAGYSFACMTVLSWYLIGKLKLLNKSHKGQFPLFVLSLLPIGLAAYIAATRLVDYRHDFADVNAGSFIGLVCGSLAYFQNYPSPFADDCDEPKLRSNPRNEQEAIDEVPLGAFGGAGSSN
ncbi:hypothetical protein BSKO_01633 [Bryopsis sp. KO-2023]|nr:hypothetical protein BSKO_01633 [Bryopsis sp. KO-2023]